MSIKINGYTPVLAGLALILAAIPLIGRVYEKPDAALEAVFPGSEISKQPVYLSKKEQSDLTEQVGMEVNSRFYTFYIARKAGKIVGYGTFYTHVVRTKEQTLFVAVDPSGKIKDVRLISFFEPSEYRPPDRWLALLKGKGGGDAIMPGKDLPAISGASLTSRSTASTARLVLAIFKLKF
ncbi:MAG: hypothetical protein KDK37_08690 [Leptospiraceae bacterium]|nr:hypothetical protein [Leptospiraceae bacterium]